MKDLSWRDRNLVDEVKELYMVNCIDGAFEQIGKTKRFMKSKRATRHYLDVISDHNGSLGSSEAIDIAISELVEEGRIIKLGNKVRRKFDFE